MLLVAVFTTDVAAQQAEPAPSPEMEMTLEQRLAEADRRAEEALAERAPEVAAEPSPDVPPLVATPRIPLWKLLLKGGWLMVPIAGTSFVVVLFGFERLVAVRRRNVIPPGLVAGLEELAGRRRGLDPRQAYQLCHHYPSATASVLRAVLLKVGRPHVEVERSVTDAIAREAAKLYKNVRPLNLAAALAPLLGLLGTVWGMILAFFVTSQMTAGVNRAENLAGGIYQALVTTFAGLAVAIPAAILAHYLEGRIQALSREIDELLLVILPQLERYEGKTRFGDEARGSDATNREADDGDGPDTIGYPKPAAQ